MGKWKLKWIYLSNCKHLKDVTKLSYTPTETSELYVFPILASFNDDFNFMGVWAFLFFILGRLCFYGHDLHDT